MSNINDRLAVAVEHADGTITRWGPDEWEAEDIPSGLTFSSSVPGGFKDCTLVLPRKITIDYPDLNLFDNVTIYRPGGKTVWEGRVAALPRSHGDSYTITVQCTGWISHLADDPAFQEIYIDRDLSNWGEPSIGRKAGVLATGSYSYGGTSFATGFQGAGAVGPSILISFNNYGTLFEICEVVYQGGGVDISAVDYDFYVPRAAGEGGAVTRFVLSKNDEGLGDIAGPEHRNTPVTNQVASTSESGYKYIRIQSEFTGAYLGASSGDTYGFANIRVIGTHGLTRFGESPNDGFLASDVIANVIERACPLLNFTTGMEGSIEETDFPIPHLAFRDPTDAATVVDNANAFNQFEYGVFEDREFFYRETDPERLCWEARLDEGAQVDLEGDDGSEVYNGVFVQYVTGDGKAHTVGPPGSGAETTSTELADTNPENPVNAHGIPSRWIILNIGQTTTEAGAIQLGRVYFAEKSLPQRRGNLTLQGTVNHPSIGTLPVSEVRAGDYIRISDHPTNVPRRIIEANYNHDSRTLTASLDNSSHKMEAILERIGINVIGLTHGGQRKGGAR